MAAQPICGLAGSWYGKKYRDLTFLVPSHVLQMSLVFDKTNCKSEEEAGCFSITRSASQAPRSGEKSEVSENYVAQSGPVENWFNPHNDHILSIANISTFLWVRELIHVIRIWVMNRRVKIWTQSLSIQTISESLQYTTQGIAFSLLHGQKPRHRTWLSFWRFSSLSLAPIFTSSNSLIWEP